MIYLRFIIFFFFVILFNSNCKDTPPQKEYLTFKKKAITLKLDPEYGGRIASFQYENVEVLSQIKDENNWYWGSTVWPAPQSDWNWPPPEKVDQTPYEIKIHNSEVIILRSQKDAYKNIQIEKRFQFLDDNNLEIKYSFFNWGDTTIRVGIWENTRVPYQGQVHWETDERIKEPLIGLKQGDSLSILNLKNHEAPLKLYINSEGGWITHRRKDIIFKKSFKKISKDRIHPNQAAIEVYFDPHEKFAELEVHSPYWTLDPSSVVSFKVIWNVQKPH